MGLTTPPSHSSPRGRSGPDWPGFLPFLLSSESSDPSSGSSSHVGLRAER